MFKASKKLKEVLLRKKVTIKKELNRFPLLYAKYMAELEVNLPTHLTYHNYLHTQYVIEKAQLIGEKENLSDKAL